MILQPRHFVRFLYGRAGEKVTIAFLPGAIGAYLHTLVTDVSLSLDYDRKLNRKHRMTYERFSEIQNAIDKGSCLKISEHRIQFVYLPDDGSSRAFFLLLKTNARRDEVWLVTFHRLSRIQVQRRLQEGQPIAWHEEQFAG